MSSTDERQKKCEDRIDGQLEDRLSDLRSLFKAYDGEELTPAELGTVVNLSEPDMEDYDADENEYDGEDLQEKAGDELSHYGYGVSKVITYRYTWSGGGPSDFLEVDVEDGYVSAARYRFHDWFDGAVRELHGDDLVLAERYHDFAGGEGWA